MPRLPCKYQLGAVVYHRMDGDGTAGMVIDIKFCADGGLLYTVQWGRDSTRTCYEIELTTARTFLPTADDDGGTETAEN